MPSENTICTLPASSYPSVIQLMSQYSERGKREMVFLAAPCIPWTQFTHSHVLTFPHRGSHGQESLSWHWNVLPWGHLGDTVKSNCIFCPLECIQTPILFFAPTVCWDFSAENLGFYKGSLVFRWLSKTVLCRGCRTTARGAAARSWATAGSAAWAESVRPHLWAELLPGPLMYGAGPHSSRKVLSMYRCQIVVEGRTWRRDILFI